MIFGFGTERHTVVMLRGYGSAAAGEDAERPATITTSARSAPDNTFIEFPLSPTTWVGACRQQRWQG